LKDITPEHMGFDITTQNLPKKMYQGMMISYRVSPLPGIRTTWVTEITNVIENVFFVDEQRIGPFKLWHHEHRLEKINDGVLMTDIVSYSPPLGFIGAIANKLIIHNQLVKIFNFRKMALEKKFNNNYQSMNK
jgi:ligand-binding SRPBCC domain-containing protein